MIEADLLGEQSLSFEIKLPQSFSPQNLRNQPAIWPCAGCSQQHTPKSMLSQASVESLLQPVSETMPSGEDLEYNQDFMALEADSKPKAEQQFGDTVIAAVEPDWRDLLDRSMALLSRSKDVRIALICLRSAARIQGITGLEQALVLLTQMLEKFWDTMHPQLDAEDNNDPTMRINALAALTDPEMGMRDIYDCLLGSSRSVGPVKVRDIAIANGKLAASSTDPSYTTAQIEGALRDIQADQPASLQASVNAAQCLDQLQNLLNEKISVGAFDLKPLRFLLAQIKQASEQATGAATAADDEFAATNPDSTSSEGVAIRGEIRTREQALQMLDKVIAYMERAEPGNPAPLLITRAKRLVGVNFLTIMEDLAPDAMSTIQNITGRPSS
jgi:type VI secretion system protein ImpA